MTVSLFILKINSVDESSIEQVIYFFTNKNTNSQEYLVNKTLKKKKMKQSDWVQKVEMTD